MIDQLITDVLGRAHQSAVEAHCHDEARSILRLAHRFADRLEQTDPSFDRARFIEAATTDSVEVTS